MSRALTRVTIAAGVLALLAIVTPILAFVAVRWYYDPDLPSVEALRELRLEVPMRVFTRDGIPCKLEARTTKLRHNRSSKVSFPCAAQLPADSPRRQRRKLYGVIIGR